jgi:hypothetical protein
MKSKLLKENRISNFEKKLKEYMTGRNYSSQRELENWKVHFECCDVSKQLSKFN